MKRVKLILKDGTEWMGGGFGHDGTAIGEVAFTTLMGGTAEQLTDPRCYGQLLTHTFAMVGNYGVPEGLGRAWPAGVIAREACGNPSNYRSAGTLEGYLSKQNIPGVSGIDTRALMRHMRATGPLLGALVPADMPKEEALALLNAYVLPDPPRPEAFSLAARAGGEFSKLRVAVLDFGAGAKAAKAVHRQFGCAVDCHPFDADINQILSSNPDGILLSDGYGEPSVFESTHEALRRLAQSGKSLLANGSGLLALTQALGGKVARMSAPHRGGNQPVREKRTGRLLITAQYHGWEVADMPAGAQATYLNLHGDSIEGYALTDKPVSGVQFDMLPQDGPHDPGTILKDFIYIAAEVAKVCP